jgi:hypothetical protein
VTPWSSYSRLIDPLRLASPGRWQRGSGLRPIEIGDGKGCGCVMGALACGGLIFEDGKANMPVEASRIA